MTDEKLPSGRFVVRIDPGLHALLRDAARRSGVSLNEHCSRLLALPGSGQLAPASEVVKQSAAMFGEELVGVVAFGSWARGELARRSDVDILVIVEPDVAITRALYRRWDAAPLRWESHPVEPHFVRLPETGARLSGLWAEAALDGVVLYDRDFSVSRRLVEIRHRIVAGEILRRRVYGQPYWVEAA